MTLPTIQTEESESTGIAIVTGSAGALGKAIVSQLAEDGYDIALNDVPKNNSALESLAEDVRKRGRKAIVVIGDVTVESEVKKLVETTTEKLGGLDVVSTTFLLNEM
jgi:NAD(P)-dependent dehydrogenase (short-subunit alcohol dehydrogenase family)